MKLLQTIVFFGLNLATIGLSFKDQISMATRGVTLNYDLFFFLPGFTGPVDGGLFPVIFIPLSLILVVWYCFKPSHRKNLFFAAVLVFLVVLTAQESWLE